MRRADPVPRRLRPLGSAAGGEEPRRWVRGEGGVGG